MYNFYANKRGSMTLKPTKTTAYRVRINLETGFATLFDHKHSQSNDNNKTRARIEIHKNHSLTNLVSVIGCEIRKLNPIQVPQTEGKGTLRVRAGYTWHGSTQPIPHNGGW